MSPIQQGGKSQWLTTQFSIEPDTEIVQRHLYGFHDLPYTSHPTAQLLVPGMTARTLDVRTVAD